jgi:hypothetical protein
VSPVTKVVRHKKLLIHANTLADGMGSSWPGVNGPVPERVPTENDLDLLVELWIMAGLVVM